jgi:hypothetical protein
VHHFHPRSAQEVFVQGVKTIRLKLTEDSAKLLLDPIYRMEESAPVHTEPAAAQLPIRAQEEMEAK